MVGAVRASPLPARADTEGGGGGASSGGGGSRLLTGPSAAFPRSCAVRGAGSPHRGRPRPRSPGAAANGGRPSLGAEVAASTRGASARAGKGGRGKVPQGFWRLLRGGLRGDAAGAGGDAGSQQLLSPGPAVLSGNLPVCSYFVSIKRSNTSRASSVSARVVWPPFPGA